MIGRRGFTLAELLVVVAIVGILVALGSGFTRGFLDRGRLSEAVNLVTFQLEQGRRLAKRLDSEVTVVLAESGGTWTVAVNGVAKELGPGVSVTPTGGATLVLDPPFGTYAGNGVNFGIAVGGTTRNLTVTGVLARVVQR
jgi:prepilin-type N-terminal cleavage/methylation domain-containing protein